MNREESWHRDPRRRTGRIVCGFVCVALPVVASVAPVAAQSVRANSNATRYSASEPDRDSARRDVSWAGVRPDESGVSSGRDRTGSAERTLTRPTSEASGPRSSAASPAWTIVASLLVVGLVVVLARLWRKHGPRLPGVLPGEAVEVLGRRPLDQRNTLQLVRLGSRILAVGSSAEGLRTLCVIDDPVEVDYLSGMCRRPESDGVTESFRTWFGRATAARSSDRESTERHEDRSRERPTSWGQRLETPSPTSASSTTDSSNASGRGAGDAELRRRLSERMLQGQPDTSEVGNAT